MKHVVMSPTVHGGKPPLTSIISHRFRTTVLYIGHSRSKYMNMNMKMRISMNICKYFSVKQGSPTMNQHHWGLRDDISNT